MNRIIRRLHTGALVALAGLCSLATLPAHAADKQLLIAEPVHYVGFLPIYVTADKGFFKDEGIDIKIEVMVMPAFVNAVIGGEAFAFLGSVDHNAFAVAQGKSLIAVSNLNGHANIYMMARTDIPPYTGGDLASYVRGKTIAVSAYGGTPNNVLRYFLKKWNLTPGKDVTLLEFGASDSVLGAIKAKQADLGVSAEPFITQLYNQHLWTQPILDTAKELGPFTDTAVSVSGDTIKKDPATVQAFVKAIVRGLAYCDTHRGEMLQFAEKEFPTQNPDDLKASLDRSFADGIFSADGYIPKEAWASDEAVVLQAGELKEPVSYDKVVDMQFDDAARKELNLK
jgi:NitT/TauT family transport system substrate-binding protein